MRTALLITALLGLLLAGSWWEYSKRIDQRVFKLLMSDAAADLYQEIDAKQYGGTWVQHVPIRGEVALLFNVQDEETYQVLIHRSRDIKFPKHINIQIISPAKAYSRDYHGHELQFDISTQLPNPP